jgi:tetratricopeptide (TPR) repeat protein
MEISSGLILTILLLLGPVLISRLIMEDALKRLDSNMKVKLLDAFSRQRKMSLLITLPALVLYMLALKYFPGYTWKIILGFGFFYIIYFIWKSFRNYKKLQEFEAPDHYSKKYRLATIIVLAGFIGFGIQLLYMYTSVNDENDNAYKASVAAYKGYEESRKQDYYASVSAYSEAIILDSTVSNYYLNRGTSYFYLGEKLKARKDYEKAAALGDTLGEKYLLYLE